MRKVVVSVAVVAIAVGVFFLTRRNVASTVSAEPRPIHKNVDATSRRVEEGEDLTRRDVASTNDESQTAEEKAVNAFDDLTDKWQEASENPITMSDIDNFAKTFRKIPKARQDECIHRALNLIPDENVMLLAGILMDKSMDKEIVAAVYNDILNRDEDVKKPILQEIYKDKAHPCWDDTSWILEVTGELPKDK